MADLISPTIIRVFNEVGIGPTSIVLLIIIWMLVRYIHSREKLHQEDMENLYGVMREITAATNETNVAMGKLTTLVDVLVTGRPRGGN